MWAGVNKSREEMVKHETDPSQAYRLRIVRMPPPYGGGDESSGHPSADAKAATDGKRQLMRCGRTM